MLSSKNIEFIRANFKYARDRMKDLPNDIWGSYESKMKKITETQKRQMEILQKMKNPAVSRTGYPLNNFNCLKSSRGLPCTSMYLSNVLPCPLSITVVT